MSDDGAFHYRAHGCSYRAWRISGGKTEMIEIPDVLPGPQIWRVPENVHVSAMNGETAPLCLLPGQENDCFESIALPLIEEIASRVMPWGTLYCAPLHTGGADCGGQAFCKHDVAIVRTNSIAPYAVRAAFHESWHLAEELMSSQILEDIDTRLMSAGPAWTGDYLPRRCERRARAFESFCTYITEGGRVHVFDSSPVELKIFWSVYNGDFGREIMQLRKPKLQKRSLLRRLIAAI